MWKQWELRCIHSQQIHACFIYARQFKLEHCNQKVDLFSYGAIKQSMQENIHGFMI